MSEPEHPTRSRGLFWAGLYLVLVVAVLWMIQHLAATPSAPTSIAYSELVSLIRQGRVVSVLIRSDEIVATLDEPYRSEASPANDSSDSGHALDPTSSEADTHPDPTSTDPSSESDPRVEEPPRVVATRLPRIDDAELLEMLNERGIEFSGEAARDTWVAMLSWALPLALIVGLYGMVLRRAGRSAGGPLSIGQARAKIYDRNAQQPVTFRDVEGVDEAKAELVEIVDYLTAPDRFHALGARLPKGVLLVGPPGTGKTLLARAVAGEAGVPFFSISGSEFVQMFVGVGAARVRDLFEQAKTRAPCIVFIDELDAVGRTRAGAAQGVGVHEEREQTLNQLLVEMDGFEAGKGVVILAATNRPEVLDAALLRAGRFDRQIVVDRPDVRGREAILAIHSKRVRLAERVSLRTIAQRTPGMAGADLANVVNEAALAASRRNAVEVELRDFEEAVDRIQLGLKKKGRVMTVPERRRVAHHEAGHALIALSVEHADPVHRVTIIPRSVGALGATLQLPAEERYLMTRPELLDRICIMLGGRAAERLVFDDISTGAQNDLERATETARQMVCRFGMSDAIGPVTYGEPVGQRFLEVPVGWSSRSFSDATAERIDAEVRKIIEAQEERARVILREREASLRSLADRLLDVETVDRDELAQYGPA